MLQRNYKLIIKLYYQILFKPSITNTRGSPQFVPLPLICQLTLRNAQTLPSTNPSSFPIVYKF